MTDTLRSLVIAGTASLTASILIKVTIAMALALAGVRLARGTRAAARHAVLLAAFAAMLVLPLAATVAPAMTIAVPVPTSIAPMADVAPVPATLDDAVSIAPSAPPPATAQTTRSWSWPSMEAMLLGLWAIGATLVLVPILLGLWEIRLLRQSALPWPASRALLASISTTTRASRVDVLLHERVTGPMTCGVWRHTILLPRDAEAWPAGDLSCALVHELEHVRRRDWISQCLARTLCAVYWFHPLAWAAWRRLTIEAERACDDAVLQQAEPAAYATQLVELAKRLATARHSPALAMANRRDLATRVRAVLDDRQQRGPVNGRAIAVAAIACAVLVAGLGPVRVAAGPASQASGDTRPRFDVASVKPCAPDAPGPGRGGSTGTASPGRLRIDCQTLFSLLHTAYQVYADGRVNPPGTYPTLQPDVLSPPSRSNAPEWMWRTRFTIEATTDRTPPPAPAVMQGPMLQTLLEERFQLKMHRETREVPVQELVVAKGGAKLTPFKPGKCVPYDSSVSPQPPLEPGQRQCARMSSDFDPTGTGYVETNEALKLDDFAASLGPSYGMPIVNKTGIAGYVSFRLTYMGHGTYFDSLKDQVGLELRPAKAMRDFLVIDHVEQPGADSAQAAPAPAPKFDVASIRPCESNTPGPGRGGSTGTASPGRLRLDCQTLAMMMRTAYQVHNDRGVTSYDSLPTFEPDIVGPGKLPAEMDWVRAVPYTIEATTSTTPPPAPAVMQGPMLRTLIEDRFHLKMHLETREVAIRELVVAKGGAKVTPLKPGTCIPYDWTVMTQPALEPGQHACHNIAAQQDANGNVVQVAEALTLDEVAAGMATRGSGGTPVINKTGITGFVSFRLVMSDGESHVDAMKDQLGLELRPAKGMRDFLVIDHVERPANQ